MPNLLKKPAIFALKGAFLGALLAAQSVDSDLSFCSSPSSVTTIGCVQRPFVQTKACMVCPTNIASAQKESSLDQGTNKDKISEKATIAAQKRANHFVKEQWSNHHKSRHLHVLASDELDLLKNAYANTYLKTCGCNGQLMNTAGFTLSQVYNAYYSAVAAEGSLLTL